MLRATIETGIEMGAIGPAQLKRISVDTTVGTKAIRFPAGARGGAQAAHTVRTSYARDRTESYRANGEVSTCPINT